MALVTRQKSRTQKISFPLSMLRPCISYTNALSYDIYHTFCAANDSVLHAPTQVAMFTLTPNNLAHTMVCIHAVIRNYVITTLSLSYNTLSRAPHDWSQPTRRLVVLPYSACDSQLLNTHSSSHHERTEFLPNFSLFKFTIGNSV